MKTNSLRSKVILHLAKYTHIDIHQQYGAPMDITQDGIAMALGITRSYASLVLTRMEKTGTVENTSSIVRASTTNAPRKVYQLTSQGRMEHRDLLNLLEQEGSTPEEILVSDINHQSTQMLMSQPPEVKDAIGLISVLRQPVNRKDLDCQPPSKIPFDVHGYAYIRDDTKRRFLQACDPNSVKRYHSMAADWCTDHDKSDSERLFHLVNAGRMREANRMVSSNMYTMIERSENSIIPALLDLCVPGCSPEIAETTARIALDNRHPDEAEHAIDACNTMDESLKGALRAEIELLRGHREIALDMALDCYNGNGVTGMVLGKCMMACERYDEALVYLKRARRSMVDDGFVFDLETVLALEAEASARTGNGEGAAELVSMAECVLKRKSTVTALRGVKDTLGP